VGVELTGAAPTGLVGRPASVHDGAVPIPSRREAAGVSDRGAALLALHSGPGFVLPNAWDAGSARILEQVGFPAVATTSAGIAWSLGVPDGEALDLDTMLERVAGIVAAVDVPVTADLESGYGQTPDEVGRTVARAAELGAVGGNLEDARPGGDGLYSLDEAVERLAAARAAAPAGTFVLNARTDTYFGGTVGDPFDDTVERARRYLEAGADCVFVPGVAGADTIRGLAAAIPGPLNIVAGLANTIDAPTLFSLGVQRVSLGGSLARALLGLLDRAGRELLDTGTLGFLEGAVPYAEVQRRFGA
jgi:2-methylisocitrate lyase-like PEP mutase family enzyme